MASSEIRRRPAHENNDTLIEGNIFVFDMPRGRVLSSESPGPVTLRNNIIVKANTLGEGFKDEGNTLFESRDDAGMPPFPELPPLP